MLILSSIQNVKYAFFCLTLLIKCILDLLAIIRTKFNIKYNIDYTFNSKSFLNFFHLKISFMFLISFNTYEFSNDWVENFGLLIVREMSSFN